MGAAFAYKNRLCNSKHKTGVWIFSGPQKVPPGAFHALYGCAVHLHVPFIPFSVSANCFGVPDFCVPFGVLNELIEPLSSMCTMEGFCTTQSRQQIEDVCRVRTAWRKVGCKIFLLLSNYRGIKSKFPEARFPWCVAYCYCTDCSRTWNNFLRFHMLCHDVNENQSWL